MRRIFYIIALGGLALLLSACSDFVDNMLPDRLMNPGGVVTSGQSVGQTFVAQHDGLKGIQVLMTRQEGDVTGPVVLHLRQDTTAQADLRTASISNPDLVEGQYIDFSFTPLDLAQGNYYYFFIETPSAQADESIELAFGAAESYLDGAAYVDSHPQEAQLCFRLVYDGVPIVRGLLGSIAQVLPSATLILLWLLLPGAALLLWFGKAIEFDWLSWPITAMAISLSLSPILLLLFWLVKVRFGPVMLWVILVLSLAAVGWYAWRRRSSLQLKRLSLKLGQDYSTNIALFVIVGFVLGVRLLVVRTLPAPLWGDSYHHSMIAQLFVDNGGVFNSWEPFASLYSFTYHFGFHSNVAVLHWLTGVEVPQAVLWTGQILNGLAVLALYPLAVFVIGSKEGGLGAILLAGLLSPMPMFYVNWGRYTQLAGQVLLPSAMLLTWACLKAERTDWRLGLLNSIVVGGLALTHYRVLIFYVVFVVVLVVVMFPQVFRRIGLLRLAALAGGAAVIFLPWFAYIYGGKIMATFTRQLGTMPAQTSGFQTEYNALGDLSTYMAPVWWLLFPIGAGIGLWQRRKPIVVIALWSFFMFLVANPSLVSLPGTGAVNNFAIFIAAYIPASLTIGLLVHTIVSRLPQWQWARLSIAALVIVVGLLGARGRMADLKPAPHALLTWPDMRAMDWIQHNTPASANFLVNSFFAYQGSVIVGSDGGWWLPLSAHRASTLPPLTYATELGPRPDYVSWINALTTQLQDKGIDNPDVLAMLLDRGITHVYIGQQQGRVNYGGPHVLEPEVLLSSPHFRPVYHQDRVWVFEIVY